MEKKGTWIRHGNQSIIDLKTIEYITYGEGTKSFNIMFNSHEDFVQWLFDDEMDMLGVLEEIWEHIGEE